MTPPPENQDQDYSRLPSGSSEVPLDLTSKSLSPTPPSAPQTPQHPPTSETCDVPCSHLTMNFTQTEPCRSDLYPRTRRLPLTSNPLFTPTPQGQMSQSVSGSICWGSTEPEQVFMVLNLTSCSLDLLSQNYRTSCLSSASTDRSSFRDNRSNSG